MVILSLQNYTTQAGALIQREQDLKVQIADLTSQQKQFAKENNAVAGSMDQAGIRLGRLREEYRSLTDEEKASPFGKNLKAAIDALDPAIKQADASIGNFQRSVGNYAGQLAPGLEYKRSCC
jgi:chromosome segregation ATPase